KHTGVDIMKIPVKEANKILGSVVVAGLVQAVVLAVILNSLGATDASNGFRIGVFLWLGLVEGNTAGVTLCRGKSWKFWWLNSGYFLVVMGINSVILAIWQ